MPGGRAAAADFLPAAALGPIVAIHATTMASLKFHRRSLDFGTRAMQSLKTRIPPPVVALAVGGLMKLYAWTFQVPIDASPVLADVGIAIAQISAVIALLAFASFGLARTTINPRAPARATVLVTGGIFRVTRNPLCLSLLLLLVAYAVRLGSWVEWLGPVLFAVYVTRFQIVPEEEILAQKFGAAFLAYKSRTRRWL